MQSVLSILAELRRFRTNERVTEFPAIERVLGVCPLGGGFDLKAVSLYALEGSEGQGARAARLGCRGRRVEGPCRLGVGLRLTGRGWPWKNAGPNREGGERADLAHLERFPFIPVHSRMI